MRPESGEETAEPRRSQASQEEEKETERGTKLLITDQEQGWGVGSLNWTLAAKEEAGEPKTAGCGSTEVN